MADLATVKAKARRVGKLEDKLEDARRELETAIAKANDAGASYAEIGQALGLTKGRIGEMAQAARAGVAPYDLRRDRG